MFSDRIEVGNKLAHALESYKGKKDVVLAALPRGGVVPAAIIAKRLDLPMELIMVKKITHPTNHEFAIGAVSLKHESIDDIDAYDPDWLRSEISRVRKLQEDRYQMYYGKIPSVDFSNKTAIIVDDGVATGNTVFAAIKLLREEGATKIIVAVPVGPKDTIAKLRTLADQVICLEVPERFFAISEFYTKFDQVSDEEVIEVIDQFK